MMVGGRICTSVVMVVFCLAFFSQYSSAEEEKDSQGSTEEEKKAEARALQQEGNRLFDQARYREALAFYERCFELYPTPNTAFNMAQTLRQLGRLDEARNQYETYLTMKPEAANRSEVEKIIAELDKETKQPSIEHPSTASEKAPSASERAPLATEQNDRAVSTPDTDGQRSMSPLRLAAWITLAGAAGFLAVGTTGFVLRRGRVNDYNGNMACVPDVLDPSMCQAEIRRIDRMEKIGIIGAAAGGALAAASAVLFLWPSRDRSPSPTQTRAPAHASRRISCGLGPRWGLLCDYRF